MVVKQGDSADGLKGVVEPSDAAKAGCEGDFSKGHVRFVDQPLCLRHTPRCGYLTWARACMMHEQP
jgi:hypothetical protein